MQQQDGTVNDMEAKNAAGIASSRARKFLLTRQRINNPCRPCRRRGRRASEPLFPSPARQ
jgi:hypothetical protein